MLRIRRACLSGIRCPNPTRSLSLAYQLHETAAPQADPLLILHGLFGSKQNSRSISKALARDLHAPVYALDLRNHGDSPHDAMHDYSSMASDVEQFIHDHRLQRVAIIGHSMGAKVAMTVALRSAHLLRALIPVDNAPVDASLSSDFPKYIEGMLEVERMQPRKQADANRILEKYEKSDAIRQFLMTNLVKSSAKGYLLPRIPLQTLAAALANMGDFPFKDPDRTRFEGPTLVVRGTKSRYVPDDVLPLVGRFFPRFTLRDIDAGHWVISEQPEAFKRAIKDFIQEVDYQE